MSSTPPRRLRDELKDQEQLPPEPDAPAERPRTRRITLTVVLALLIPAVIVLGYSLVRQHLIRPRVDATIERSDMMVQAGEKIQINVVNACGADGVARRFTEYLRARRFDVAEIQTAKHPENRSYVIDHVGDTVSARKVAYALGIPQQQVRTAIDSTLYLRASVVIGADYRTLRPMQ